MSQLYEFKFADIGEGVHEGEILEWHVDVGSKVRVEQLLVEVNTEKVNAEITAPVEGVIREIRFKPGDIIKVGDVLVTIDTNTTASQPAKNTDNEEKDDSLFTPATPFKSIARGSKSPLKKNNNGKILASPAVRHRAREAGIDLADVPGTAKAGRITRQDLETYMKQGITPAARIAPRVLSPGSETRIPLRGMRRTIAQSMRKSKDTAAHYTYFEEVDMTNLRDLREKMKPLMEQKGIKVSYPALVMKLMVPALKKFPIMNSYLDEENQEIVIKDYFNIGISVDTEEGLVVPVVKNVEHKTVWEIADDINTLAQKARDGKLSLADISGGTISLTSVGNIGGLMATPILKTPESAILGLMKAKLRPVVVEQNGVPEIAIRYMMNLSLSLDHRIIDGAVAARFVAELIQYLEEPVLGFME